MRILALDIGGAYTKKSLYNGEIVESSVEYFPVWKNKQCLGEFLKNQDSTADVVAVTMTAELCDAFNTRREGAEYIVEACLKAFEDPYFLTCKTQLVKERDIHDRMELAAANWLASLYLLEKRFGEGVLLDIGSTTTDILPFGNDTQYKSDFERLKNNNLVYTGYLRTPVNTIVSEVPMDGSMVAIASEYFSITADVYNILWGVNYTCDTPDGGGKTKKDSMQRIARLLCADLEEVEPYIESICRYIHDKQTDMIASAVDRVSKGSNKKDIYCAGIGSRLGLETVKRLSLNAVDLEKSIANAWNLPCLGLIALMKDGLDHG